VHGSHAGSHWDERLRDSLDVTGQPTGIRPRLRTDLNTAGRPHGESTASEGGAGRRCWTGASGGLCLGRPAAARRATILGAQIRRAQ
jgi:hypothetical protein